MDNIGATDQLEKDVPVMEQVDEASQIPEVELEKLAEEPQNPEKKLTWRSIQAEESNPNLNAEDLGGKVLEMTAGAMPGLGEVIDNSKAKIEANNVEWVDKDTEITDLTKKDSIEKQNIDAVNNNLKSNRLEQIGGPKASLNNFIGQRSKYFTKYGANNILEKERNNAA